MFICFLLLSTIGILVFMQYCLFTSLFVFLVCKVNPIVQWILEHNLGLEKLGPHNLTLHLNHLPLMCPNHFYLMSLNHPVSHPPHLDILPSHLIKRIHMSTNTCKHVYVRISCMVMLALHIMWKPSMMIPIFRNKSS